ncbi:MAG: UDP-glucose:sterol glucosyltransferase [Devosia sp.]|uniref:glycosyltransferase n=1 Tax=Devosia sp. TaxID=1871048 RepID=UPI002613B9A2|nr:glycosyltransferase [Devosia sp.]MDB5541671.1 UDP-glucose:sterol glucosyltransferase [Devosia sp.]
MSKRIAIAAIGTMGDVQPFVALSLALMKRGHSVVLCATNDFEGFVTSHGVEFATLGSDIQAFMRQSQFDNVMSKNSLLYAPKLLRDGQKIMKEACRRLWAVAQDVDAIIFHQTTNFAVDVAEALDIPAIMTAFQPINPTGEFPYFGYDGPPPEPLFNRISLDPLFNRLSYVVQAAHQSYYDFPRDRMRAKLLGLRSRKRSGFSKNARGEPIPALHAYSQVISPRPGDWPDTTTVTGFWRLDDITGWEPDAAFRKFLDAGEAPIYLGFGSMPWGAQRNTEIITRALRDWGGRAVVGKGWGGIKAEDLPDTVYPIDKAPHTKLFPLMKALVHHGGAGTAYAGLYAGRPTFVVPHFFDQPYWGRRIYELGCGPAPVRLRKLTPSILATALEELATDTSFAIAASELRERLVLEDGTGLAADIVEETIETYPGNLYDNDEVMGAAS